MLEQELKDIWNNSSRTANISIETKQLVDELNAKVHGFQKIVRIRDVREISASVIGMLIFGYFLYEIPFPITKLACSLSIIWFALVILKFRKSKKRNTNTNLALSMTDQLAHQEETMQEQAVLIKSAAYWYSLPSFIINFIFIVGLENPTDYNWTNSIANDMLPLTTETKIFSLIAFALFYGFIIWVNRQAVLRRVNPLIEAIKIVRKELKND